MKTIHALADEIVDLYAAPLELPRPLQPFRDQPSFDAMILDAIGILQRRPGVARGLALRYPVILVVEPERLRGIGHRNQISHSVP